MKITIICSDEKHPVYPYLIEWKEQNSCENKIEIISTTESIKESGDILFLVSCSQIVTEKTRSLFRYSLVLHASDLPKGRGWSPHVWDLVEGKSVLTLSLLNAEDSVDTGNIWKKKQIKIDRGELFNEINHKLFTAELELMSWACSHIDKETSTPQDDTVKYEYRRKRTVEDSQIDINQPIVSQFNLLRISDPERYPAYIVVEGQKYKIKLEKIDD